MPAHEDLDGTDWRSVQPRDVVARAHRRLREQRAQSFEGMAAELRRQGPDCGMDGVAKFCWIDHASDHQFFGLLKRRRSIGEVSEGSTFGTAAAVRSAGR
jgi:hypothetical protein